MKNFLKDKLLLSMILMAAPLVVQSQSGSIRIDSPQPAPEWALLQRDLLRELSKSCQYYFNRYFDERGYLLADERWGGDDGPDDAIENVNRWPELYALGGSDKVMELYKKAYEGHLRQYSEVKGTHVPFIRDGMYFKEFPTKMDWVHNSEGLTVFYGMGLGDPYDYKFQNRVRRFAGFYMNEDPSALNYDSQHKIIRSMINGSRGPLMRKSTALDWAGDPSEIKNRYLALHGEDRYEQFLYHFKDYYNTLGDHPLNLLSTSLPLNAFALTGEEKYRNWILEYVNAWYDRMKENGWLIPSNIGLDGTIGGETDGKWYGGTYGWSFTIESPHGSKMDTRTVVNLGFVGFMNAYLITGDDRYLDAWRKQDEVIYKAGKTINGVYCTPRNYGNPEWSREGYTNNDDWYNFQPGRDQENKLELYYLSWKPGDRALIQSSSWLDFLEGNHPGYAVDALRDGLADVHKRMEMMRNDSSTPDTRLSDVPMSINPASTVSMVPLIRLIGGGIYTSRTGFFTRLRYFNPVQQRAGLPNDVAALVDGMTDKSVRVKLVNLNLNKKRILIIQGGGYAEHQLLAVTYNGIRTPIDDSSFKVTLEPGTGASLNIEMRRYVNKPTMDFPWLR